LTAQDILNEYKQPPPLNKDEHLYCFAIIRRDLNMETGKLSAQAGHAYTDVIALAEQHQPQRVRDYRNAHKGGSKVTLKARNENQLIRALNEAREAGIPAIPIVDANHVIPNSKFDGSPIITAIGIGPCRQDEVRHITKRFNCV
jgi:PTH2 family peptidyl-tRNA hydrolase|tara:strand:+ start:1724 stop:2155 length:432 start_codon:yes stop_codon:yes gene_type:complete